jgi:photosystem II stability/assembly factor-like uncharacterized protein
VPAETTADGVEAGLPAAAVQSGGVLKSSDGGKTWSRANSGVTNLVMSALVVDPNNPLDLFASTEGGVFRSDDGGHSWQPFDRGLPAGGVAALAVDPTRHTLYAGTNGDGVHVLPLDR